MIVKGKLWDHICNLDADIRRNVIAETAEGDKASTLEVEMSLRLAELSNYFHIESYTDEEKTFSIKGRLSDLICRVEGKNNFQPNDSIEACYLCFLRVCLYHVSYGYSLTPEIVVTLNSIYQRIEYDSSL
jgi:hypothetical protein